MLGHSLCLFSKDGRAVGVSADGVRVSFAQSGERGVARGLGELEPENALKIY